MNETVLITGASSGYGKATAELFLERGWNVVATMRKPKPDIDAGGGGVMGCCSRSARTQRLNARCLFTINWLVRKLPRSTWTRSRKSPT
jgi:NAD(P)-dependent dehydrogenase (short-subunit alcohol dehydrogenase family)